MSARSGQWMWSGVMASLCLAGAGCSSDVTSAEGEIASGQDGRIAGEAMGDSDYYTYGDNDFSYYQTPLAYTGKESATRLRTPIAPM